MDKRIAPEPPVPLQEIRSENVELKVQQGVHKEAFEFALQQAEHRRTMSNTDRLVTAGKQQAEIVQALIANNSLNSNACQRLNTLSLASAFHRLQSSEKEKQAERSEQSSDFLRADFTDFKSSATSIEHKMQTCSNRRLSTDSLLLLREKINITNLGHGETISIELVDDPSGVVEIKITKGLNNSWTILLSVQSDSSYSAIDEAVLSKDLKAYLCQCAILVNDVSIGLIASQEHSAGNSLSQGGHGR